jgi:hypothetical protein
MVIVNAVKKVLPETAPQWLLWIAVIIGLLVSYKLISKEVKKGRLTRNLSQNVAIKEVNVSDLSFTDAEYSIMADRIYGAFNRWIGYNFDTLEVVLKKLKTASDFYKLVTVYGVRDISPTAWINQNMGLIHTIENQLSDGDLSRVTKILQTINVNF